ncbi:N-6 DNA methylase [Rhizobium leguminosarum]|uniref:N-6 DNA methylase n=1 Tax=Rhizobium leguminosarum TaxID=384 RepID=UPI003F99CA92
MYFEELEIGEGKSVYAGKTLLERVTGRFYTPHTIGSRLAEGIVRAIEDDPRWFEAATISVCDPFAGDGRLIIEFLKAASRSPSLRRKHYVAACRDVDAAALSIARSTVSAVAVQLGLTVELRIVKGDAFKLSENERHDVVITNPPWELVKPDSREMDSMSQAEVLRYKTYLRERSNELNSRFPNARAGLSWGGWTTNLARCGWDLSLRMCAQDGLVGIVLPSTLWADQASETMRRSIFNQSTLVEVSTYTAEARLFDKVDQPVVAAIYQKHTREVFDFIHHEYDHSSTSFSSRRIRTSLASLKDSDYVVPIVFGSGAADVLDTLRPFRKLGSLESDGPGGIWAGREIDETRIAEVFSDQGSAYFVKGRMIQRHGFAEAPTNRILPGLAVKYRSASFERVVWRDVARASQKRRMVASVIPPGWIAGNSLHVLHCRDGNPIRLRAIYAVLSSLIMELQIRSRLATSHMSLGVVRTARIPDFDERIVESLGSIADGVLKALVKPEALEVAVAKTFNLTRDEFALVIGQFPKISMEERESLLSRDLWF